MSCLEISRLWAHKVAELESYSLVVSCAGGSLEFQAQFVKLNREEADRHVAVERLGVCPALHTVFVSETLVYFKESVKLVVVDVSVLKCAGVYNVVNAVENLFSFPFVVLY